jgi:retron-type reverse transcriptase
VNWVLDADIRGFFDNLSHAWALKFIEHRVADCRILRLIQKWLQAGISEEGQWSETKQGTPQGAVVSPLIAPECAIPLRTPTENLKEIPRAVRDWHRERAADN